MGWKIVRDKQKEFCQEHGVSGSWRFSERPVTGLAKKLFEETSEYVEYYNPEELYDVRDVLDELLRLTDPDGVYLSKHYDKVLRMGLFSNHLEWSPDPNAVE